MTDDRPLKDGGLASYGAWLISPEHNINQHIEVVIATARSFFREASLEEKLRHRTSVGEGYRAFGTEYTDFPDQPDLVEVFACSIPRADARLNFPNGPGLTLYESLLAAHPLYADLATRIARQLLAAAGTELPADISFDFLNWSRLQLNFGITRRVRGAFLNACHEDRNFLTIGFATAPGIELATDDGSHDLWQECDRQLVVLAGSILSIATHRAIRTGFHLVRRRRDVSERIALVYFADASPAALVQIDPSRSQEEFFRCITDGWLSSGVAPVQHSLASPDNCR